MLKAIRHLVAAILALMASASFATTLIPIQLLNPVGSTAGQALVSTSASAAPAWTSLVNSVAGRTGVVTLAVADVSGAAPTANPAFTGAATLTNSSTSGGTLTISAASNTSNGVQVLLTGNGATTPSKYLRVLGGTFGILNNAGSAAILTLDDSGNLTTTGGGSFTTLNASANDALQYSNTAGQTVASGSLVTVTTWTKIFDRVNANFNATTGVFTAPATGYYQISGQLNYAAAAGVVGAQYSAVIVYNGVAGITYNVYQQSTSTAPVTVNFSANVSLAAGQTLLVQAFQASGSSRTLQTGAASYLSINRIP